MILQLCFSATTEYGLENFVIQKWVGWKRDFLLSTSNCQTGLKRFILVSTNRSHVFIYFIFIFIGDLPQATASGRKALDLFKKLFKQTYVDHLLLQTKNIFEFTGSLIKSCHIKVKSLLNKRFRFFIKFSDQLLKGTAFPISALSMRYFYFSENNHKGNLISFKLSIPTNNYY